MWIPDDIVAEIAAIAPDPRPLLLTCRQFYRVFTEMPDIAYWCSGKDPAFLMPKHVPEVWDGLTTDIIDADNIAVFARIYNPAAAGEYVERTHKNDAVNICRFLYERHGAVYIGFTPNKCMKYYNDLGKFKDSSFLSGIVSNLNKNRAPLEIKYRQHGTDLFETCSSWAILRILSATYPLPDYTIRDFLRSLPNSTEMREYLKLYKPKVTLTLLAAMSTKTVTSGAFMVLLEAYNDIAAVVLDTINVVYHSARERDILTKCGARDVKLAPLAALLMGTGSELLDIYLQSDPELVRDYVNSGKLLVCSHEMVKKCAAYGITLRPTVECLHLSSKIGDMVDNLLGNPALIEVVPKWVEARRGHIDFHGVLHRLEQFAAEPGYSSAVAGVIAAARYEDGRADG